MAAGEKSAATAGLVSVQARRNVSGKKVDGATAVSFWNGDAHLARGLQPGVKHTLKRKERTMEQKLPSLMGRPPATRPPAGRGAKAPIPRVSSTPTLPKASTLARSSSAVGLLTGGVGGGGTGGAGSGPGK